ncbi:MAG: hypothetical protein AAF468_11130 [Pseudomonadota bacterium]
MKTVLTFAALSLAASAFATSSAQAGPSTPNGLSNGPVKTHQLAWRCGKNNPAMWGTFGNGCLKQKRKWKKQQQLNTKRKMGLSN